LVLLFLLIYALLQEDQIRELKEELLRRDDAREAQLTAIQGQLDQVQWKKEGQLCWKEGELK
jgi:hypothetical protein